MDQHEDGRGEAAGALLAGPAVLVEFPAAPGVKDVSLKPQQLVERSGAAIEAAMNAIREMANRVSATVAQVAVKPDQVQVEFGLKLDAAPGALIAKAGAEAHLQVTVTWDFQQAETPK